MPTILLLFCFASSVINSSCEYFLWVMCLHPVGPQGYEVEDEWDEYAFFFFRELLEGTGIPQGSAIAPCTRGFWENHPHRHVWPTKPWEHNKFRFACVPVQTDSRSGNPLNWGAALSFSRNHWRILFNGLSQNYQWDRCLCKAWLRSSVWGGQS